MTTTTTPTTPPVRAISTTIRQPWLTLGRVGWGVLVLVVIVMYVIATPLNTNAITESYCLKLIVPRERLGLSLNACTAYHASLSLMLVISYLAVCFLIILFRSHERVGLLGSVSLALFSVGSSDVFDSLLQQRPDLGTPIRLIVVAAFICFLAFFYVFPDGKFHPRWTRYLMLPYSLWALFVWVLAPISSNTVGLNGPWIQLMIGAWFATGAAAQIDRYRRVSTPNQRQQTKWIVVGGAILLILFVITIPLVRTAIFQVQRPDAQAGDYLFWMVSIGLRYASVIAIPWVFGISILRYRLWDIDLVISRTLVFGAVTGLLALVFMAVVVVVQQLAVTLTGGQQSNIAVAAAALAVAALFQPSRIRLRQFIDKRFYPKYLIQAKQSVQTPELVLTIPGETGPLSGKTIGTYQVQAMIGRGGMAEVYKGQHLSIDRAVAIKTMSVDANSDSNRQARFEREANLIARLRHPNIVQLYDFGRLENVYYMVMEYIAGHDLQKHLREARRLSVEQARPIARDIASALDYAHSQGLVHRDIKPSNILLHPLENADSTPFRAVLTDFGIAKMLDSSGGFTKTGMVGTLDYIAPEQIVSAKTVDQRADIYSFGIMLYQMLTGTLPFDNLNIAALLMAHLQKPAPDPRVHVPNLSPQLAGTILQALEKEPAARPASASEIVAALWR